MVNVRFLNKLWSVTVAEVEGVTTLSAFSERFKVGVQEEIPGGTWERTPEEHRADLLKSLATLSLIDHAFQLRCLTATPRALPRENKRVVKLDRAFKTAA